MAVNSWALAVNLGPPGGWKEGDVVQRWNSRGGSLFHALLVTVDSREGLRRASQLRRSGSCE